MKNQKVVRASLAILLTITTLGTPKFMETNGDDVEIETERLKSELANLEYQQKTKEELEAKRLDELNRKNLRDRYEKFMSSIDKSYSYIPNGNWALRNNNPGNLRSFYKKTGYRKFSSMKDGYKALIKDLNYKISGKSIHTDSTTTLEQFIYIYAPPHENNSKRYTKYVCRAMNMKKTDKLINIKDVHRLAKVIIFMEDRDVFSHLYPNSKKFRKLMKSKTLS